MVAPSWRKALDRRRDFLDHDRRKPKRWLVEQQKSGLRHHRPAEGQHLLLAAAERAGQLPAALGKPRKQLEDAVARLVLPAWARGE